MSLPPIILLGKSGYAIPVILDLLRCLGHSGSIGIIPNIADEENESLQYPFLVQGFELHEINYTPTLDLRGSDLILASIGKARSAIYHSFLQNFSIKTASFPSLIHPSSVVGAEVIYGKGFHLSPLSVIAPFSYLGDFNVINRGVSIGHHCKLGDFVTVNPGANIAGLCQIADHVTIGAGAVVLDRIKIGKASVIGAGSVVTKDIPEGVIAFGSPARIIRQISH